MFCDFYAHTQPKFLLCCKFQIIILKTVGEVVKKRTLIGNEYKAIFLSKSRVCNTSKKKQKKHAQSYILTSLQVSNNYPENCRSCGDKKPTMPYVIRQDCWVNQEYVTLAKKKKKKDQSSVTFMHMPSLYFLAASIKSLSWKWRHKSYYAMCIRQIF